MSKRILHTKEARLTNPTILAFFTYSRNALFKQIIISVSFISPDLKNVSVLFHYIRKKTETRSHVKLVLVMWSCELNMAATGDEAAAMESVIKTAIPPTDLNLTTEPEPRDAATNEPTENQKAKRPSNNSKLLL